MLWLSELMIQHPDLESFGHLVALVREEARRGKRFLRMDAKPPFADTPEDWEDRLESAFTAAPR